MQLSQISLTKMNSCTTKAMGLELLVFCYRWKFLDSRFVSKDRSARFKQNKAAWCRKYDRVISLCDWRLVVTEYWLNSFHSHCRFLKTKLLRAAFIFLKKGLLVISSGLKKKVNTPMFFNSYKVCIIIKATSHKNFATIM